MLLGWETVHRGVVRGDIGCGQHVSRDKVSERKVTGERPSVQSEGRC